MNKKLLPPIIITILLVLYLMIYGGIVVTLLPIPMIAKILLALIPIALIGVSIYVLKERVKEIKSGETDDLDQY